MGKAVLQIMEEGPQPMREKKPSEKNPNGVDQFQSDHQREYENYESQGDRRSQYVDDHNAAYPKLKDELQNRQSTARPSACITNARRKPTDQIYLDPNCPLCQKLKLSMERKKRMSRTKTRRDKRRRPEKKSRVKKPKPRKAPRCKRFKLARIGRNVGVQHCYQNSNRGTEACFSLNDGTDEQGINTNFSEKSNSRRSQDALSNPPESETSSKSFMLSQYPDTSVETINSCNSSDMSLNHQPMISR